MQRVARMDATAMAIGDQNDVKTLQVKTVKQRSFLDINQSSKFQTGKYFGKPSTNMKPDGSRASDVNVCAAKVTGMPSANIHT